ncbi:hypothetical protein HanIR_Chr10g0457601 [Helianthus annuus]|nr:hypothetical protein HanIR_Chr10g0457601 [Helianthus annuus]
MFEIVGETKSERKGTRGGRKGLEQRSKPTRRRDDDMEDED